MKYFLWWHKRDNLDVVDWAKQCADFGAGEVLLTSWIMMELRRGLILS